MNNKFIKTVKLDAETYFNLREYALVNGLKMGFIISQALKKYLSGNKIKQANQ